MWFYRDLSLLTAPGPRRQHSLTAESPDDDVIIHCLINWRENWRIVLRDLIRTLQRLYITRRKQKAANVDSTAPPDKDNQATIHTDSNWLSSENSNKQPSDRKCWLNYCRLINHFFTRSIINAIRDTFTLEHIKTVCQPNFNLRVSKFKLILTLQTA